jgi:hypothetical protein
MWLSGGEARPEIPTAIPVIVADNVVEYFMEASPKDVWVIDEDFPNLAPPFDAFWIEGNDHNRVNVGGVVTIHPKLGFERFGFLCLSRRNTGGWLFTADLFIQVRGRAVGPLGTMPLSIHADGSPRTFDAGNRDGESMIQVGVYNADRLPPQLAESITDMIITLFKPLALALSLMHCKNVRVSHIQQPAPLNKKWLQKHGRPLVRYRVLDIGPMKSVLKNEGRADQVGLKQALHICRGHFATYTEERPLFGKVSGTFWKPQHVRGSAQQGVVFKDYNVKAPRPTKEEATR